MESSVYGQIQCDHISDSRGLRRFTDKQIKRWIQKKFAEAYRKPITYLVELRRAGSGHTFDCHIQIRCNDEVWVGSNYKGEVHQALIHCLRRMNPNPIPAY